MSDMTETEIKEMIEDVSREHGIELAKALVPMFNRLLRFNHGDLVYNGETVHFCYRSSCAIKDAAAKRDGE